MRLTLAHPSRLVLIGAAVLMVSAWLGGAPSRASPDGAPTFVGANECKKCHFKQFKSWKETKMAKSFALLKPGEARAAKVKAGLDPAKDYTTDETCLRCHTTGPGEAGGYAKGDDEAHRTAREGVQCESCHGAGSAYNAYMQAHEKTGYVKEEAAKAGLLVPGEQTCTKCHRGGPDGSPSLAADAKFDWAAKSKEEGSIHAHLQPKK